MLQIFQNNWGTVAALLVVAFIVFLAIRRMVLDKKAGIGACGQKCSQCAKMGNCEESEIKPKQEEAASSLCSGLCSSCQYSASCHNQ